MKVGIFERMSVIRQRTHKYFLPIEFLYICTYAAAVRIRDIHRFFSPLPPISIRGEVILVTSGSAGLGRAICTEIAQHETNLTIIIWGRNEKSNSQVVAELQSMGVRNAFAYKVDVSDRDQVKVAADKIRAEIGDVTMLFNNAAISGNRKVGWVDDPAAIEKVISVNVLSHCWTIREFLPRMIEKGQGHIIEMCSLMGVLQAPYISAYVASKHALRGYIESIKEDIRHSPGQPDIHFSMVYPPGIPVASTDPAEETNGSAACTGKSFTSEFMASKIIDGVLQGKEHIYAKEFVRYAGFLNEVFPADATRKLYDFMGISPMLDPPRNKTP